MLTLGPHVETPPFTWDGGHNRAHVLRCGSSAICQHRHGTDSKYHWETRRVCLTWRFTFELSFLPLGTIKVHFQSLIDYNPLCQEPAEQAASHRASLSPRCDNGPRTVNGPPLEHKHDKPKERHSFSSRTSVAVTPARHVPGCTRPSPSGPHVLEPRDHLHEAARPRPCPLHVTPQPF